MTRPLDHRDMKRPRRRFNVAVHFVCPWCSHPMNEHTVPPREAPFSLRVVKFRRNSVRLECGVCGIRFSVDPAQVADALDAHPATPRVTDYSARDGGVFVGLTDRQRADGTLVMYPTAWSDHAMPGGLGSVRIPAKYKKARIPPGVDIGATVNIPGFGRVEIRAAHSGADAFRKLAGWSEGMHPAKRFRPKPKREAA